MRSYRNLKLLAYKAGLPGFLLFFFRYMPLDPAYKAGSRGIKPVKHVWLEGIRSVLIRDTGVLWISKKN